MSKTCVITGATGFLGGFITAGLLERGYRVIALVRPREGKDPRERSAALMDFFHMDPGDRLETVAAELGVPGLGIPDQILKKLRNRADLVLNCAADTSFAARFSHRVHQVNVEGVKHLFEAFRGCGHFHHMSTAYVAGKRVGPCLEELEESTEFHNPYEESKYEAERLITMLCQESNTPLTIHRPAVVYGDHETGKCLGFNALYYPARVLLLIKNILEKDLRERKGLRAAKLGVSLEKDGRMRLPLTFTDLGGSINLLPVDHLVRSVLTLVEKEVRGIFHILGTGKETLTALVDLFKRILPFTGITSTSGPKTQTSSPLESMVDTYLEAYYPYFCDQRIFDDTQAARYLGPAAKTCPPLDEAILKRCMDFAISMEFGAKLAI